MSDTATATRLLSVVDQLARELQSGYELRSPPTLDSSLDRDLGFDSLTRVELLVRIEEAFDISIPEQILTTIETPRDFLRAVRAAGGRLQTPGAYVPRPVDKIPPAREAPVHADTLIQILEYHANLQPDRPHIRLYSDTDDGEIITYGTLLRDATQIARSLRHYGLVDGETVLIMLPTGREYFISYFGALLAGGVPVPLYPPGRLKQLAEHLNRHASIAINCQARIMITTAEARDFARLMHHRAGMLQSVVTVAELKESVDAATATDLPNPGSNDTALLQYTSGSTGMPKGVILSHANLLANIRAMGQVLRVTADDIFVSWLPLYHDMGLIGAWLGSLYYGCPLIIMSPLAFIARPIRWLQAIHRYGATLSAAPNFAYELCLRRIGDQELAGLNLQTWRSAFNGAEAVSPTTVNRFIQRFSPCGFHPETMTPVYGLAESSVGLAFPPHPRPPAIDQVNRKKLSEGDVAVSAKTGDRDVLEFVSCGSPLPGHQIRIVDDQGRELPDRSQGRLQFTGPSATSGYFRNPDQTRELFDGPWLNSGDMAYIADGEVYITGRSKDIIIRGGRNIYPTELEEAIGSIDGISKGNVAVFGGIDKYSGTERLVVMAETRKRQPASLTELRTEVIAVVNDLCGIPPDDVVLAPPNTVLKTSSGKIRRAASRSLYERGKIGKKQHPLWLQIIHFRLASARPAFGRLQKRLAADFYACYTWLLFGLAAPIAWCLAVVIPPPSWRWAGLRGLLSLVRRCAGMPVFIQGLDNLPPSGEICILVSNHASYLDSFFLMAILPRHFSFIAKAELRRNPLLRLPLQRLGVEFVDRFDQQQGLRDVRKFIQEGRTGTSFLFFAEGTFVRMPGLLPFHMGAFLTAAESHLPVVPVAIRGTRSILRGDSWYPRRHSVTVMIGKPIPPPSETETDSAEAQWHAAVSLRDTTRAWILRHCGEPDLHYEHPASLTRPPAS
jgi:acyl carrier protein